MVDGRLVMVLRVVVILWGCIVGKYGGVSCFSWRGMQSEAGGFMSFDRCECYAEALPRSIKCLMLFKVVPRYIDKILSFSN